MTARIAIMALILVGVTTMTGCFDFGGPGGNAAPHRGTDPGVWTEAPEDFVVHDVIPVLGAPAGERTWTWRVPTIDFESFTVQVRVTGPEETPAYHAQGLRIVLEAHDASDTMRKSWGSSGGVSLSVASNARVLEHEGVPGNGITGPWRLTAELGPGAYTVHVDVELVY